MEIDSETASTETAAGEKKAIVVILIGAPASGKSTFCDTVMQSSTRPWARICQDTIAKGKAGTRAQCVTSAVKALQEGKSIFIDRCNLDREQRADFVKLGGSQADVHAVVLDLPAKLCISRIANRTQHEGNLQGGKAAAVVNRMLQKKELPKLSEGFSRITFCQSEADVKSAVDTYSSLGPSDILPSGCFGQKTPDAKVQQGIMKFLKKVDAPTSVKPAPSDFLNNIANLKTSTSTVYLDSSVPTLAFPSISTADFQFDLEKASDVIVEQVEEFVKSHDNVKLVLVDLSERSKILSLVRTKATIKNIDPHKFLTFVGDITKLSSERGLRCNAIANAANWRLKPGGGGVNSAIFSASGPSLEILTKEKASTLSPGKAVGVPLSSDSPLFIKEGVTHVIHVLGPNMNPQRPNCLDDDYIKGCSVLRDAYRSLFEAFASIAKSIHGEHNKLKRESEYVSETNKKSKEFPNDKTEKTNSEKSAKSSWGSWAQALHKIAMHPDNHKNELIEISDDVVVLNDLYPKAQKHILVLARSEGVDSLSDVNREHIQLLKTMHDVGLKYTEKYSSEKGSLVFRLGYHSVHSMRQLHLHVVSQDFDSKHLKNKKHWNSFNSPFFRDSLDVIDEVSKNGKATINSDESFLSMELRCHRCRSAHPNIPRLKSHIAICQASFSPDMLRKGQLVV